MTSSLRLGGACEEGAPTGPSGDHGRAAHALPVRGARGPRGGRLLHRPRGIGKPLLLRPMGVLRQGQVDKPQRRRVRPDRPGQVSLCEVFRLAAIMFRAALLGARPQRGVRSARGRIRCHALAARPGARSPPQPARCRPEPDRGSTGYAVQAVQPGLSPAHQRRAELLGALLGSSLGRPLLPQERAAADVALSVAEERTALPTLPLVAEALLRPEEQQARLLGTNLDGLRQDGRQVALELRRLVHGDLAGMFDGETSPGLDLSAGVVVLDLSRLYASPALGLLMVCALSWLQSTLAVGSATKRLVVLDEAWALLSHLATARWLQATFKLSRSYGVANVAVVHRLSDLKAAGQEGSEQQRLAEGLLADAETRVVFGQAPGEAERAGELLGLSRNEQALLCQLPRGVALWRVGQSSFLVEHELCPEELALADTDGGDEVACSFTITTQARARKSAVRPRWA